MLPPKHVFSLSPTVFELGAEICSNGRQTITQMCALIMWQTDDRAFGIGRQCSRIREPKYDNCSTGERPGYTWGEEGGIHRRSYDQLSFRHNLPCVSSVTHTTISWSHYANGVATKSSRQWWCGDQAARRPHILCSICFHQFCEMAKAVRLLMASFHSSQFISNVLTLTFCRLQPFGCHLKGGLFEPPVWGFAHLIARPWFLRRRRWTSTIALSENAFAFRLKNECAETGKRKTKNITIAGGVRNFVCRICLMFCIA